MSAKLVKNTRKEEQTQILMLRPPDPNIAVATPDTYLTIFGSMRKNLKSPKSTFNRFPLPIIREQGNIDERK